MRQSMSTIVIAERALLREGLVSLLQHTPYKVIAAAARASELKDVRVTPGQRTLALLQIEGAHSNVEEVSESIGLLRSLFSDCRVVVIAEGSDPIDIQRIMTFAPDGYILNLGFQRHAGKVVRTHSYGPASFCVGAPDASADPRLPGTVRSRGRGAITDLSNLEILWDCFVFDVCSGTLHRAGNRPPSSPS